MRRLLYGLLGASALSGAGLVAFSWWTARRVDAAVPPTGQFLEIDGQRIHYTDQGQGRAVLFIHGLGGQTRNFPPALIAGLADTFRVVVFDRPGSGHSSRPLTYPAGVRRQAATIAELIRRLGMERPLVVGHSLGGAVALALALDHPEVVGGLALIAPLTQVQEAVPEPFRGMAVRSRWLRLLLAWTLAVPAAIRHGGDALGEVFGPDPIPGNYGTEGGGLLSLRPSSYYHASSDMVVVNDDLPGLVKRYPTLTVPVGILFGTADRILDPRTHGALTAAAIPGAELEFVEAGGHMMPITAPARTAAFIERIAARMAALETMPA
jgi:pimeloyl-ACP methyl ester carboxylesterase